MNAVTAGVVADVAPTHRRALHERLASGRAQLGFAALSALLTTAQLAVLALLAQV
jgi:hypothetical protein